MKNDNSTKSHDANVAKAIEHKNVDSFLKQLNSIAPRETSGKPFGRLIFGMDATASRQHSWDQAANIQCNMFHQTVSLGTLDVQLTFYRGINDFKVSRWTKDHKDLETWMTSIQCRAGQTQLNKLLSHCLNETQKKKVNALVFIGDSYEEDLDHIATKAGKLAIAGTPAFIFQEGSDPIATYAFSEIARLTHGAHFQFDSSSAQILRDLLTSVAIFAVGGHRALSHKADEDGGIALQILDQLEDH